MPKLFRSILSANRKRRNLAAAFVLWLLRQVRDVEEDEMRRYEDRLDKLPLGPGDVPRREYSVIEDAYLDCERALDALEHVIDYLELEYCAGRF